MRRAVLVALVSVVLVTATGTLGAVLLGDAPRDAGTAPFAEGNGTTGSGANQSTDDGGATLPDVEDALLVGKPTGGTADGESGTASGSGDGPGSEGRSDGAGPTGGSGTDADSDATGDDADGDDVSDDREASVGTDPTEADTDGDGLPDDRELELGTDPTEADTDADGLADGWEVAGRTPGGAELPGADPLSKDVYVQFDYAGDAQRRGEAFYEAVAETFAEMPVDNPDGSTGIDVHVRDGGRVNESAGFTGDNFWALKDRYYGSELGARAGVYHQVLVTRFSQDQVGYGEVGGRFNVVAAGLGNETARRATVHELLHNVVGRVEAPGACQDDPKHYCEGGYLSPEFDAGEEQYLAEELARQLERQGFAD